MQASFLDLGSPAEVAHSVKEGLLKEDKEVPRRGTNIKAGRWTMGPYRIRGIGHRYKGAASTTISPFEPFV